MKHSVIVSAKRTPIGSFNGVFAGFSAPKLGSVAIKAAVESAGLKPNDIQNVIMGNVICAGEGQAPARQAMLYAGLSQETGALTVNKVCGSGLKAVMLADQAIRAGDAEVVVAGGMENMTMAPYALEKGRQGFRMGNAEVVDLMIKDGLWDPYGNKHMGVIGEKCAVECKISRSEQDQYAIQSYQRALAAIETGKFKDEIVAVSVPDRKGHMLVEIDEEPGRGNTSKMGELRPAFDKNGSVTAGNASSINDGAAAVVVMSEESAKAKGIKPLVRIVAQAESSQDPEWFTTAPALAMEKALHKAKLKVSDIDLWEVNEAFAVVALVNQHKLKIPNDRINVNGGAVSLGHPIGASGARILVTLIHELLRRKDAKRGMASLCIGGGEAVAVIVEKI